MYKQQQNLKRITLLNRLQNVNGKTFAAVVLFTIMGLLWARVLLKGRSGPDTAAAQAQQQMEQTTAQAAEPVKLIPVKLPVLEGRHDVLAADMFSAQRCRLFGNGTEDDNGLATVPKNSGKLKLQANLEKIADTLKLEAVVHNTEGTPFQVFVNDTILTVGSVLTVKEGPQEYELVLKTISENEAVFVWREFTVTVSMAEPVEK